MVARRYRCTSSLNTASRPTRAADLGRCTLYVFFPSPGTLLTATVIYDRVRAPPFRLTRGDLNVFKSRSKVDNVNGRTRFRQTRTRCRHGRTPSRGSRSSDRETAIRTRVHAGDGRRMPVEYRRQHTPTTRRRRNG